MSYRSSSKLRMTQLLHSSRSFLIFLLIPVACPLGSIHLRMFRRFLLTILLEQAGHSQSQLQPQNLKYKMTIQVEDAGALHFFEFILQKCHVLRQKWDTEAPTSILWRFLSLGCPSPKMEVLWLGLRLGLYCVDNWDSRIWCFVSKPGILANKTQAHGPMNHGYCMLIVQSKVLESIQR